MDRQQGRRRILFAALIVPLSALGSGPSASAKDAQKIPDYFSKADFQLMCESLGGTFMEDGLGNTECHYPDGSWTECDANGADCWHTPARPAPPVEIGDGQMPSAPIVDDTENDSADDNVVAKTKHHKGKHGKAHGRHGKGRKK